MVTGESLSQQTSNSLPHRKKPAPNVTGTTVQLRGESMCAAPVNEKNILVFRANERAYKNKSVCMCLYLRNSYIVMLKNSRKTNTDNELIQLN